MTINPGKNQNKIKKLMRKGIIATNPIKIGQKFTKYNLGYARPAIYFGSTEIRKLLGKKSKKNYRAGYSIN